MSEYKEYDWDDKGIDDNDYLYNDLQKTIGSSDDKLILDIGCGNGYLSNKLIDNGYNVYGIDASKSGIKIAKLKHEKRFFLINIEDKQLPEELKNIKFNTIISTEVIEHLYNPRGFVKFCKSILSQNGGGEIVISTPYHGYLKNLALAITNKMDNHFTVLWDGGHIKFWSKKTLTKLLSEFGFKVLEFRGCGRVSYLWKSMFIKAKI